MKPRNAPLIQQINTLQEYILIEQDFVDIEVVRRSRGWQSEHFIWAMPSRLRRLV
jgi:hypothetical protein